MSSQYLMIVDGLCPACSSLGREVAGISQIRPVAEQSSEAKSLQESVAFTAPCLVEIDADSPPRIFSGWRMRLKLIQVLGWRQSRDWLRLLYKELEARQSRGGMTRRNLLAGAGIRVLAAVFNVARAAANETSPRGTPSVTEIGLEASQIALASAEGQQAVANWGPATSSYRIVSDGHLATALVHSSSQVSFLLEEEPRASFSLGLSGRSLEIYAVNGALLATLDVSRKGARPIYPDSAGAHPQNTASFGVCLVGCLGLSIDTGCILNCAEAALNPVNGLACIVCAGANGISCAWGCRGHLL